ncbi:MAG: hypothetical protein R3251_04140, partial [Candidatus Spechtbacterales bacterium]|nr:hypothetical protein [Candidatus Spechtbacterales bacterium]
LYLIASTKLTSYFFTPFFHTRIIPKNTPTRWRVFNTSFKFISRKHKAFYSVVSGSEGVLCKYPKLIGKMSCPSGMSFAEGKVTVVFPLSKRGYLFAKTTERQRGVKWFSVGGAYEALIPLLPSRKQNHFLKS